MPLTNQTVISETTWAHGSFGKMVKTRRSISTGKNMVAGWLLIRQIWFVHGFPGIVYGSVPIFANLSDSCLVFLPPNFRVVRVVISDNIIAKNRQVPFQNSKFGSAAGSAFLL